MSASAPPASHQPPSTAGLSFLRALCWVAICDGPLHPAEAATLARITDGHAPLHGCLAAALELIDEIDRSSIADACRFVSDLSLSERRDLLPCAVQLAVADGAPNATEVRSLKMLADMCCAGVGAWETLSETFVSITGAPLPEDDAPWCAADHAAGTASPAASPADAVPAQDHLPRETVPAAWLPGDAARLAAESLYAAGQSAAVLPMLRHMAHAVAGLERADGAADLLLQIARRRRDAGDHATMVTALRDALSLCRDCPFAPATHASALELIPELMRAGRHEDAGRCTAEALEIARHGADRQALAATLALHASLLNHLGRHADALEAAVESIEEGCRGAFPSGWSPLDVGSEAERALAAMERAGEVAELWESISSLSAQAGHSAEHLEATVRAALAMEEMQRFDRALPLMEAALAVAAETGLTPSCGRTELRLKVSACLRRMGQLELALEADRAAERDLRADGNLHELARCMLRIADDLQARGDAAGAEAAAREAAQVASTAGERLPLARAHHLLGTLLHSVGRHAEALEAFGNALAAGRDPEPLAGWKAHDTVRGMGRCLAASGDAAAATEILQTLADEATEGADHRRAESLHAECAELLERQGLTERAAGFLERAERSARLAGDAQPLHPWRLARARCLDRLGRGPEAAAVIQEALAEFRQGQGVGTGILGAVLQGAPACGSLAAEHRELAGVVARGLHRDLKAAAKAGEDAPSVALGLLALFVRAGEALQAPPEPLPADQLLAHLLKALELLERAERKGRLPNAVAESAVRELLADGWTLAAALLEASGDRMSAAGARASAAPWRQGQDTA